MSAWRGSVAKRVLLAFAAVLALAAAFAYGAIAYRSDLPPIPQLASAADTVGALLAPGAAPQDPRALRHAAPLETHLPGTLQPGLVLVAGDIGGRRNAIRVIDRSGRVIQEWPPAWTETRPADQGDVPEGRPPAEGGVLHGLDILPDASIVANLEHFRTFRMDACGSIGWMHANVGHQSVHYAEDGTLWITAETVLANGRHDHAAPLHSWTLRNLDLDGTLLREIPVIDLLVENDLGGLLFRTGLVTDPAAASSDMLHLNDVDSFPEGRGSAYFAPGDLLVSLHNINTVLVFDPDTRRVKFVSTGTAMRQHDPDFLGGDRISIFGNRTDGDTPEAAPAASRIVEIDVATGARRLVLDGRGQNSADGTGPGDEPFYSRIPSVHQRLSNGNILVVSGGEGRVLEFTPAGRLAWRYDNRQDEDLNRRIHNAMVLPESMDEAFFAERRAACTP